MSIAIRFLFALIVCLTPAISDCQLLPRVGVRLWSIGFDKEYSTGAIDYAPVTDLVFSGNRNGEIRVIRGGTGELIDRLRVNTRLYGGQQLNCVMDVSCTTDGRLLSVVVTNIFDYFPSDSIQSNIFVVEYPSGKILYDSLYNRKFGISNSGVEYLKAEISPHGRYLALPNNPNGIDLQHWGWHRVLDIHRGTSVVLDSISVIGNFDDSESSFVCAVELPETSPRIPNRIALWNVNDLSEPPRYYDSYGTPRISADGRYLMTLGYTLDYPGAADVIDVGSGKVIWHLGPKSVAMNVSPFWPGFMWAEDASKFILSCPLCSPGDWVGNIIFNYGDSIPTANMSRTVPFYGHGKSLDYGLGSAATPDLSIGLSNRGDSVLAVALNMLVGVNDVLVKRVESVYPNPTKGEIHIRCEKLVDARQWNVVNIAGETVAQGEFRSNEVGNSEEGLISLPHFLASGMYVVTVTDAMKSPLCSHMVLKH
ncbi:MAG: T9SS type A sorting domain-containing protein [Candidatus Kapabacteria bacterium]|nr:T9SS type A sorting domain-containing protein [Candidatus Kapabacteria bacterium]